MAENTDFDQEIEALNEYPNRWPARRRLVERMVEAGQGTRAAEIVWGAPTIPQEPAEIAWALSILSKHMTRRAVRLTHALIEKYTQKPHVLARLADCLEREGCGLQAARVYGAAQLVDSAITDAEFESGLMALDAAGTAAAGIAGKGEVVGVLNWVPGGGKGVEAEDPTPEIESLPDQEPTEKQADAAQETPPASAPAKPSSPPAIAPKAGAPPSPPSPPAKSTSAPPVKKPSVPSSSSPSAPAKTPSPAAAEAAKPAAASPAPAAAKTPVALKKPVSAGAPKTLGAPKMPDGPVGPPKIAKVPGKGK